MPPPRVACGRGNACSAGFAAILTMRGRLPTNIPTSIGASGAICLSSDVEKSIYQTRKQQPNLLARRPDLPDIKA